MSRIAPSYDDLLDALCDVLPHVKATFLGTETFAKAASLAERAGRRVDSMIDMRRLDREEI